MTTKLTSADIYPINIQDDADSIPIDDNFQNLKNKINENIDSIAAAAIGTTNAETTNSRPYHTSLKNRLDSIGSGQETLYPGRKNYLKYGGVVSLNSSNQIEVTAGEAKVNGIDVKWSAPTATSVTAAAANKHRVDIIAIQSDSTLIVLTGGETDDTTTDPVFQTPATTQMSLGCIYVDDTGPVGSAYALKEDNYLPNYYIKVATTLYQGKYNFNNLIIDNSITADCTSTTGIYNLVRKNIIINCTGNFYTTSNGDFSRAAVHVVVNDGDNGSDGGSPTAGAGGSVGLYNNTLFNLALGYGGDGYVGRIDNSKNLTAVGGGGGGGGSSIVSGGGNGGAGGSSGATLSNDGAAGSGGGNNNPFLLISAYNINISGGINFSGDNGTNGSDGGAGAYDAGGGGGGGDAGGIIVLLSRDDVTIDTNNIDVSGGNGGNGGDADGATKASGGGGGGGGSGGLVFIRSLSYTLSSSIVITAGNGGTGGTASGGGTDANGSNGSNGSAGVLDQYLYDEISTDLTDNFDFLGNIGMNYV